MVKNVSTIVAKRNPAGAPRPLPNPMAMGTLKLIAVMGAAFATAMNRTLTRPTAPARRPAVTGWWSPGSAVPVPPDDGPEGVSVLKDGVLPRRIVNRGDSVLAGGEAG